MATGRMLNKSISLNKAIASMSDDTSRLLFTWAISHLDVEGRIHGDPVLFRSIVAPRLTHITDAMVEGYIAEWAEKELIIWYEADGDMWIAFPRFEDNQRGLKKDREAKSRIPSPEEKDSRRVTQDLLRRNSGVNHDYGLPNRIESNIKEINTTSTESERKIDEKAPPDPPEKMPPAAAKPPARKKGKQSQEDTNPLYHAIKDAFLSANEGNFTNWGKEGKAIKGLIDKATRASPEDPEAHVRQMMGCLWELKTSGERFYQDQPFTPSTLNASGIWDRVTEKIKLRGNEMADLEEYRQIMRDTGIFQDQGALA